MKLSERFHDFVELIGRASHVAKNVEPNKEGSQVSVLEGGIDWSKEPDNARLSHARELLETPNLLARDTPHAISELEALAEQGSVVSMWCLGWVYAKGNGVTIDSALAEKWLIRATERGPPITRQALAAFYFNARRFDKAMPVVEDLVRQNYAPGLRTMGRMYANGWGVDKDTSKARELLQRASDAGNLYAKAFLGRYFLRGQFGERQKWHGWRLLWQAAFEIASLEKGDPSSVRLR